MSRAILVTVSDDRFGRKEGGYKRTQDYIRALHQLYFSHLGLEIRQWDFDMIRDTTFYKNNKTLLDNIDPARNGRAYKPFVIWEAMQHVDFGDYIIYNDCSPELWNQSEAAFGFISMRSDLSILKNLVDQNGDILSCFCKWDTRSPITNGLGIHTHANFTLDRCIKRMGLEAYKYDYQHASGFIALRKSEKTLEYMREWMHWNCIDECASMGWAAKPDNYEFWDEEQIRKMGHRHDQSISGLLLNRMGANLLDLKHHMGLNPYNFLTYCKSDTEYQFISSNNKNIPAHDEIIKGSTVVNENGVELTVYEFQPHNGIEHIRVGKNISSTYLTTRDHLTLLIQ